MNGVAWKVLSLLLRGLRSRRLGDRLLVRGLCCDVCALCASIEELRNAHRVLRHSLALLVNHIYIRRSLIGIDVMNIFVFRFRLIRHWSELRGVRRRIGSDWIVDRCQRRPSWHLTIDRRQLQSGALISSGREPEWLCVMWFSFDIWIVITRLAISRVVARNVQRCLINDIRRVGCCSTGLLNWIL